MGEPIREIVADDIPRIETLIELAGKEGIGTKSIERLCGMTNRSYKVVLTDDEELLVRVPGEGTEKLIDRMNERKSTELACDLGIDSDLLYFGDDGTKVMSFIHDPQPMNNEVMRLESNILQAAEIFHRLHYSGVDTGVRFEVFEMARLYEDLIKECEVELFDDYEEIKEQVMRYKSEIDKEIKISKVPCHNDSLVANWVLNSNGRLYLVDWEYSGMNEAMWDLSCLSIEAEYTSKEDDELLKAYFAFEDTVVGIEQKKHFIAAKMYVDYLWTLWGLTRVPYEGEFMRGYAAKRYERLKKSINDYDSID
ncbi:MAG: phosphotransferase family protein [Clostridia bacterium]|nr:phosphotransferase family protein [Clostridia bacterium]